MGTYILSKYRAKDIQLNPGLYNVMIRITNPQEDFPRLKNEKIFRDILELKFYDFIEEQGGLIIFNDFHLHTIIDFFEKHKNSDNLIIHCDQGISRSAGVAVGWFLYKHNRASIYKIYHNRKHIPNKLIVTKFFQHLKKSMKYIIKWEREKFQNLDND